MASLNQCIWRMIFRPGVKKKNVFSKETFCLLAETARQHVVQYLLKSILSLAMKVNDLVLRKRSWLVFMLFMN